MLTLILTLLILILLLLLILLLHNISSVAITVCCPVPAQQHNQSYFIDQTILPVIPTLPSLLSEGLEQFFWHLCLFAFSPVKRLHFFIQIFAIVSNKFSTFSNSVDRKLEKSNASRLTMVATKVMSKQKASRDFCRTVCQPPCSDIHYR